MQLISVFLDIATFADFRRKNAVEGMCHVICVFFGPSLVKV